MRIINTETLIQKQIKIPTITGVYDPLSRRRDGTITPQAPIVVSGSNLNMLELKNIRLCLIPAVNCDCIIEVIHVYKYSDSVVIVALPALEPGEYFPAVKVLKSNRIEEGQIYVIPASWIVHELRYQAGNINR